MKVHFIPAAHFHCLTPCYEALMWPFTRRTWERITQEAAYRVPHGGRVLDLGCGPGSVLRWLRNLRPDLRLTGTDIDPSMVRIARRKAEGKNITFDVASIEQQPFEDRSVDVAVSSLTFHHLPTETKRRALIEARRLLKREGVFLLCDFSKPVKERWWLSAEWWKHIEPEIIPQLEGQLFDLAREAKASIETLCTFYGCISLHLLKFPTT